MTKRLPQQPPSKYRQHFPWIHGDCLSISLHAQGGVVTKMAAPSEAAETAAAAAPTAAAASGAPVAGAAPEATPAASVDPAAPATGTH